MSDQPSTPNVKFTPNKESASLAQTFAQRINSQQQLIQKQEYFRTHIPSEDYDSFSQFCLKTKGNLNIALWTVGEAHELVEKFLVWKEYFGDSNGNGDKMRRDNGDSEDSASEVTTMDFVGRFDIEDLVNSSNGNNNIHQSLEGHKNTQQQSHPYNQPTHIIDLTPKVIKIQPKHQFTPQKLQKSPKSQEKDSSKVILSASEVMDLLTFTPQKSKSFQQQMGYKSSPKKEQVLLMDAVKQKKISTPSKSSTLPLTSTTKLHPIITPTPTTHLQKRSSQPSLPSSTPPPPHKPTLLPIPKVYKQQFHQTLPCLKSPPTSPQLHSIKLVSIKKHQIIQKAFFLPDYVMYHIELKPIGVVCKRNYDDFKRLYDTLVRFYPMCKVPYLQQNSWLSQTNIELIKKQKVCLQYFLNSLIQHSTFTSSPALHHFLTLPDHKSTKRRFQHYQQTPAPSSLQHLSTPTGQLTIRLDNTDHYFIEQAGRFSQQVGEFFRRYNQLTLSAISNYQAVARDMLETGRLLQGFRARCGGVKEMEKKLGMGEGVGEGVGGNFLKQLPETLKVWEEVLRAEYGMLVAKKQLWLERMLQYTKYQQANIGQLSTLLSQRSILHQHHLHLLQTQPTSPSSSSHQPPITFLPNKPPSSYLSPQLSPHLPPSLLQPSLNLTISSYHLAYANTKLKEELVKEFEYLGRGLREVLRERLGQFMQREGSGVWGVMARAVKGEGGVGLMDQ